MGVDYDAKLIIGFELDSEKVEQWMKEHGIEDSYDINELLKEKFPEIPEKICKSGYRSSTWSIYIVRYGNNYNGDCEYFLTFYEGGSFKIKDIDITPEMLDIAKKVYKEIIEEEVDCPTVSDIEIFSVLYVW